uniref:Target of rapamycin complex subunit LST8 n=1 Tax=Lactuca sativa TaxID=4236 RepID=A0A9R1WBX4_LACSA|nr:hypothetical protein LSAT_V11C200063780 [Lactuca sativa]
MESVQTELISGDQNGNIRVWDLTANSCSCELVDTSMRSLTVMWDGSLVVAVNNKGTCYVWRLLRGTQGTNDRYGHTIDNDVLIVTETLHKRDFLRICMSSVDQYMWIHHLLHTFPSGGDFDEDEDDSDTEEEIEMKNEDEEATGKMETTTALPVSNGVVSFLASGILKQNEVNSKSSTKMESPILIPMTEYSFWTKWIWLEICSQVHPILTHPMGSALETPFLLSLRMSGDKVLLKLGQGVRRLGRGSNNKSNYDNINSKKHG